MQVYLEPKLLVALHFLLTDAPDESSIHIFCKYFLQKKLWKHYHCLVLHQVTNGGPITLSSKSSLSTRYHFDFKTLI